MERESLEALLTQLLPLLGIAVPELRFPLIIKSGTNADGRLIRYYLNYSDSERRIPVPEGGGVELLSDTALTEEQEIVLKPWGFGILESPV